jgi:hypothetical protein
LPGVLLAERLLGETGGLLLIACVNPPSTVAPRLASASEPSLLRLRFEDHVFRTAGFSLNHSKIAYHIFCASSSSFADLATIAVPAGLTGGSAHSYTAATLGAFHTDLYRTLTAQYLWEATLRVQWSQGISLKKAFGNFIIENTNVIRFPVLRVDQATVLWLDVQESIKLPYAVFQAELEYTAGDGRRILRVMAYRQPLTGDPTLLRGSLDEAAAAVFLAKVGAYDILTGGAAAACEGLNQRLARVLPGPPRFEILEALMHSMVFGRLYRQQRTEEVDRRVEAIVWTRGASFVDVLLSLYPRIVALDGEWEGCPVPANGAFFTAGRVLMFHTEEAVFVWVGEEAGTELMERLFGVTKMPAEIGEKTSEWINEKLRECSALSQKYLPVVVIGQGDPREQIFGALLVDTPVGQLSLSEWAAKW